jgi:diguanylate cyclase
MNMNDGPNAGRAHQAELARRVLKTLAERRLIPTPETFSDVYHELAGTKANGAGPAPVLRELLKDLVRHNRITAQEAGVLNDSAHRGDWLTVRDGIDKALARRAGAAAGNWPHAALNLLKLTDALHTNWTRARKLEAVARVLEGAAETPDVALDRLTRLLESWGPALASGARRDEAAAPAAATAANGVLSAAALAAPSVAAAAAIPSNVDAALGVARAEADAWKQVALRALKLVEASCPEGSPAHSKVREYMAQNVTAGAVEVDKIVPRFTDVVAVLDRQLDEERKVRVGLQRLLALLCSNIKDLTPDEAWLAGQLEPLRALLAGPIKSSALEQAETRLAQLIAQQAGARRSLLEAKIALKEMLATLIARVGSMGASTGKYYEQVGAYQRELEQANDFATLSRVIQGLLADTALMRTDIQASQAELEGARRKVEAYEQRVRDLERELTQVSTLVQKDPLTTALNRRGLEEAFRLESARATRFRSALSLMMIDLDDFKRLNDSMGHVAGDRALVYFANLIQATLRPTDQIARLGGEEFALLLPATEVAEAVAAGQRLQRELAKQAFDYEGQSRAISFSGGAAQWTAQEQLEDLIRRADRALYEAKRLGKNRVVKAE